MEQTSFHQENFRRRTRYTVVFLILAAVFCVVTVLNINTGNVHIPVPKILRILSERRSSDRVQYYMEDSSSENSDGGTAWWCIISFRLLLQTFFQSNRRTFRSRNFFRSENGRGTYNDRIFEIYRQIFFVHADSCSIYRITDLDGIYTSDVEKVQHMASLLVGES